MLSQRLFSALTALLNDHTGMAKLDQAAAKAHWKTVAAELQAHADARVAMSTAAQARQAQRADDPTAAKGGRPPSTWYDVAFGSLWEVRVLGLPKALELVTEVLTENPGNGAAPTQGSLAVSLSKNGQWWRKVETDNGRHDISVQRSRKQD